jgi:hypothetical protein
MATIRQRRQANGSIRYTAIVRLRKGTVLLHQEYRTFKHLATAQSWARRRALNSDQPCEFRSFFTDRPRNSAIGNRRKYLAGTRSVEKGLQVGSGLERNQTLKQTAAERLSCLSFDRPRPWNELRHC